MNGSALKLQEMMKANWLVRTSVWCRGVKYCKSRGKVPLVIYLYAPKQSLIATSRYGLTYWVLVNHWECLHSPKLNGKPKISPEALRLMQRVSHLDIPYQPSVSTNMFASLLIRLSFLCYYKSFIKLLPCQNIVFVLTHISFSGLW